LAAEPVRLRRDHDRTAAGEDKREWADIAVLAELDHEAYEAPF
jgi:hypothetical protein